jgi:orotate phosphoribosyltransferase
MALFELGDFTLASGAKSDFKIECDALTNEDWDTLGLMIVKRVPRFSVAIGVPSGGIRLATKVMFHAYNLKLLDSAGPRLIVDDVWTTGGSMRKILRPGDIGYVVFARGSIPEHPQVDALFTLDGDPR